jgi:hypothetical protein
MQNWTFDETLLPSDDMPEDDIDQLFQKLEPLAVPESAIQQILARINQLPPTLRYHTEETSAGQTISEALS